MARKQAQKRAAIASAKRGVPTKVFIGVLALGLVFSAGAVLFGHSDDGVINVAEVINQSNLAAQENGKEAVQNTRQQTTNNQPDVPNGGLVGTGKPDKPAAPPSAEPDVEGAATTSEAGTDGASSESEESDEPTDVAGEGAENSSTTPESGVTAAEE